MVNKDFPVQPRLPPPLDPSLLLLTEEEQAFLSDAAACSSQDIRSRILALQKRAYETDPYPCIRAFQFVKPYMAIHPMYPTVLEAGKAGDTLFLDLGCMMGVDVRKLVYDGYPASHVFGCDLHQDFIDMGHDLFGDKETCLIHFFTSNVLDLNASPSTSTSGIIRLGEMCAAARGPPTDLAQVKGFVTHLYTGQLFHLFDEAMQFELALRLAVLVKRSPGTIIFGRHRGLRKEGYILDDQYQNRYGHSDHSWPILWRTVFAQLEGEEFAEKHTSVRAQIVEEASVRPALGDEPYCVLYWSVHIM